MNGPDQDTLLRAIEDARPILEKYLKPRPRNAAREAERLLAVLDNENVVHAPLEAAEISAPRRMNN